MRRFFLALVASAALLPCAIANASAATLPTLPKPDASFDSGSIHVDRYGNGQRALVFIPGLGCGPWTWAGDINKLRANYSVYALTLDGFDGRPFVAHDDLMGTFANDFWAMLDAQKIARPVVVGHSLGGTLSFLLAEQHPERLAGAIAVDGLPVFPTLAQAPAAARAAAATNASASVAGETHEQLLTYEKGFMKMATTQTDLIDETATLEAKSDPKAIAAWLAADLTADLRPNLAKATLPMIELMPYAAPSPYTKDQTLAFYQSIVAGAPQLRVVPIENARHFAMLDQPAAVDAAITQFLATAK